jgi:hypothetical protein
MSIDQQPDRELKLSGLTICSVASDDVTNICPDQEAISYNGLRGVCCMNKSTDRVRVYVSCNRVRNLSCL